MKMHLGIRKERDIRAKELENLSQEKRVHKIEASGELEFKRSLLSSDPKLREKLKTLRGVVEGLRVKYPEIIGMTIFGSHVKGYANNESDIDASIYLDEDKIRNFAPGAGSTEEILKSPRFLEIQDDIAHGISYAGLKSHGIDMGIISKDKLVEKCQRGYFSENTMRLFHLAAGKGIYGYRELVISTLENMGEKGEKGWSNLMSELFLFENMDVNPDLLEKRRNLYPKTLAEGRRYFLSHAPKDAGQN